MKIRILHVSVEVLPLWGMKPLWHFYIAFSSLNVVNLGLRKGVDLGVKTLSPLLANVVNYVQDVGKKEYIIA